MQCTNLPAGPLVLICHQTGSLHNSCELLAKVATWIPVILEVVFSCIFPVSWRSIVFCISDLVRSWILSPLWAEFSF